MKKGGIRFFITPRVTKQSLPRLLRAKRYTHLTNAESLRLFFIIRMVRIPLLLFKIWSHVALSDPLGSLFPYFFPFQLSEPALSEGMPSSPQSAPSVPFIASGTQRMQAPPHKESQKRECRRNTARFHTAQNRPSPHPVLNKIALDQNFGRPTPCNDQNKRMDPARSG